MKLLFLVLSLLSLVSASYSSGSHHLGYAPNTYRASSVRNYGLAKARAPAHDDVSIVDVDEEECENTNELRLLAGPAERRWAWPSLSC